MSDACQLAPFSPSPCHGRLVFAHLIPQQLIKRSVRSAFRNMDGNYDRPSIERVVAHYCRDRRGGVLACGGITGVGGHHGELDHSRRLRVPRASLPPGVEEMAVELGLEWWLDREYGSKADG